MTNDMKQMKTFALAALLLPLMACGGSEAQQTAAEETQQSDKNIVVETIMARRSIRKYKDQPVEREKLDIILECGINAPSGMNKQPWEVRVVDNPEYINGATELFKKESPKMAEDPGFKNMFRNAPVVIFIAYDKSRESNQYDCGLLSENMVIAAQSMGLGTVCLGGPVHSLKTPPYEEYLKKLGFSEGYELCVCIGVGYPDEAPDAKPRDAGKAQYVD